MRLTDRLGGARWLSRRLCMSAGHACGAHPAATAGWGGAGPSPCRGLGEEGEGGGGGTTLAGGGAGWGDGGGVEATAGAPRSAASQGGVGKSSTWRPLPRVGGRPPPSCLPAPVGEGGLLLLRPVAPAEAAAGAAPPRPAPAPLLIEGLWGCSETGGGMGGGSGGDVRRGYGGVWRFTHKAVHTEGGAYTRRCTQKAACSHRRSLVI